MKPLHLAFAALSLSTLAVGCGTSSTQNSKVQESEAIERHITATNCEIFIDKISVSIGSHGSSAAYPYLKILKDRLDGDIAEVGFREKQTSRSHSNGDIPSTYDWRNIVLTSVSPVNDYWTINWGLMVGSDYGSSSFEGVFYVKTIKGTFYWAKPADGGNFVIDREAASKIYSIYPNGNYGSGPEYGINTQDRDDMKAYNPSHCY